MATRVGFHSNLGSHGKVAQQTGHGSKPTNEASRDMDKVDEGSSHASVKQLASIWSPKGLSFLIDVVIVSSFSLELRMSKCIQMKITLFSTFSKNNINGKTFSSFHLMAHLSSLHINNE